MEEQVFAYGLFELVDDNVNDLINLFVVEGMVELSV